MAVEGSLPHSRAFCALSLSLAEPSSDCFLPVPESTHHGAVILRWCAITSAPLLAVNPDCLSLALTHAVTQPRSAFHSQQHLWVLEPAP